MAATKKKVKRYRLSVAALQKMEACDDGVKAFKRYAKGRKAIYVTVDSLHEYAAKGGRYHYWLARSLQVTGRVGNAYYLRGDEVGWRNMLDGGAWYVRTGPRKQCSCGEPDCYIQDETLVTFPEGEMPESYHAAVRAARQRLRATQAVGDATSQPA